MASSIRSAAGTHQPSLPIGTDEPQHGLSVRTASLSDAVQLQHPSPDLQSLQGAYIQNVERLEETAERMSMGSNVAEEIRKMHTEQKISDSRRSSLRSVDGHAEDAVAASNSGKRHSSGLRSRNVSTSSYTNSIVDVNNAARFGGYSPAAYVGSPKGSLRSGSWSQVSHTSAPRSRSASKGSRLGRITSPGYGSHMVESPVDEPSLHDPLPQLDALRIANDGSFSDMFEHLSAGDVSDGPSQHASRIASDGSFTKLFNTMVESNGSQSHLSAPRIPSDTSFTDVYNQIASEIHRELDNAAGGSRSPPMTSSIQPTPLDQQRPFFQPDTTLDTAHVLERPPPVPPHSGNVPTDMTSDPMSPEGQTPTIPDYTLTVEHADGPWASHLLHPNDSPDRPATAASADTYQQAQVLFQDFDGAHYAPSIHEASLRDISGPSTGRPPSMLKALDESSAKIPPPPAEGMVYYPAPVPRMLNLPKRLSQMPAVEIQAKRRTQMLSNLPSEVRKSAPWLAAPEKRGSTANLLDQRKSAINMANIPAQLRASMFFENPGLQEEVDIKNESAVETLEDLLDASALAPVSAFTDHPIVGHIGAEVYRNNAMKSATSLQKQTEQKKEDDVKKRRGSFLGLRRKSVSAADELDDKRASTAQLHRTKSRSYSLGAALDDTALARAPAGELAGGRASIGSNPEENGIKDEQTVESENEEQEEVKPEEEAEYVGPPTTLLAELQLRKAQQKSRTRTAATSFPNGMHSTLLELDAVAQLEKSKRKKARVALAWEDPEMHAAFDENDRDEDVPLGMLFPGKQKQDPRDLNRPLGLLAKRELEENEPLSNRRNRLLGIDPRPRESSPSKSHAPAVRVNGFDARDNEESDPEHEEETLGQRLRRLKNQKELNDALGDVEARPVSVAFSAEMLGELGVEPDSGDKGKSVRARAQLVSQLARQKR